MLMLDSVTPPPFDPKLQAKIDFLMAKKTPVKLGALQFSSPLLLAPMSGICHSAFRLLMQDLGAGGSISEFVSCHGINYQNQKTLEMLTVESTEKHVGIQVFGESPEAMAKACAQAATFGPEFIDINMGCPVKKVVGKGGGSALLRDTSTMPEYLAAIKKELKIPLTIKIRLGWDEHSINAQEVIQIAHDHGIEMVSVHGRTRTQAYRGKANWELIEQCSTNSPLPIIGNGDLHHPALVNQKLKQTNCPALMIARGCLRHPFIFLESLDDHQEVQFHAEDIFEIVRRFHYYLKRRFERPRGRAITLRKHIVWFAAGYPNVSHFRSKLFQMEDEQEILDLAHDYFHSLGERKKQIDYNQGFMEGGHG